METKLVVFKNRKFVVSCTTMSGILPSLDVVTALTGSNKPRHYWALMKKRAQVATGLEDAILTAESSKATFNLTPSEYKELKGLERENLRDHMSDLELILSMLGEAATTEIAKKQDAQGFDENRTAARKGGRIAGGAREKLEQETDAKIVSKDNYLIEPESRKRLTTKACNSQK